MFSVTAVLAWCFLSMIVGIIIGLLIVMYISKVVDEYVEADDFPDAEWVKDYEEIKKDGH